MKFDKQIERLKSIFNGNKEEGDDKKKIENLVFFLILLVITIVAINFIWNGGSKNNEKSSNTNIIQLVNRENTENTDMNFENGEYDLQSNLKNILSKIDGAGKVEVLITYTQTSEFVPLYNETIKESVTEEADTSGGTRTIEQKDNNKEVAYIESNGEKQPITQKVVMPQIEGALILAEGANNAEVKNNIIQAVEAVTGISSHKIQVFLLSNENENSR